MAEKSNQAFESKDDSYTGLPGYVTEQEPPQYQAIQRQTTIVQPPPQAVTAQPTAVAVTQPTAVVVQPHASTLPPGVAIGQGQANVTVTTTNVVDVHNRQIINVNPGTKGWSTGLCSCFDDIAGCLCVHFCTWCEMFRYANRLGESPLIICCVPCPLVPLRMKLRLLTGTKGSVCNDCCCVWCCFYCVLCQMKREMDYAGVPQAGCC